MPNLARPFLTCPVPQTPAAKRGASDGRKLPDLSLEPHTLPLPVSQIWEAQENRQLLTLKPHSLYRSCNFAPRNPAV